MNNHIHFHKAATAGAVVLRGALQGVGDLASAPKDWSENHEVSGVWDELVAEVFD